MIAIDIEKPENCQDCLAYFMGDNCEHRLWDRYGGSEKRSDDCPLKSMKLHRKCKRVDLYEVEK